MSKEECNIDTINRDAVVYNVGDNISVTFSFDRREYTRKGEVLRMFKLYGVNNDNLLVIWIMEPLAPYPSVHSWEEMKGIGLVKEGDD